MDRRRVLLSLIASGIAGLAPPRASGDAAVPAPTFPTTAARREDVRIIRAALALHPGVHRYLTPATLDTGLERLEREFLAARDLDALYLALSRFLATIRCGHTYANFYNQRRAMAAALFDRRTRLPFEFRWIDGRMVVTRSYADVVPLPVGTIVKSVDGLPASRLLAALLPYARADGHNVGKARALLTVRGVDRFEYFDVFQGLLLPPRGDGFRLMVQRPGERAARVEVPALTLAERRARLRMPPDDGSPLWTLQRRSDGVVVLTMPSWAMYSAKWKDWEGWLTARLDEVDGAAGLIVDLRDNEGGEDCGDVLLGRLSSADIAVPFPDQRLRFQRTPAELDPYLDTWDDAFRTLGAGAADLGNGFYARPQSEAVIPARAPRLPIRVAALVGPTNSSATFQFAMTAQDAGLVRLFGTETGGNRRGINGGAFFFVRLPGTGLEFDLPLVGYFPRVPQPDRGVVPDVVVTETIEDLLHGRDRALEAAAAWARG